MCHLIQQKREKHVYIYVKITNIKQQFLFNVFVHLFTFLCNFVLVSVHSIFFVFRGLFWKQYLFAVIVDLDYVFPLIDCGPHWDHVSFRAYCADDSI